MANEKLAGKLDDYLERLGAGKVHKIKPHDVEKLITKLKGRRARLLDDARDAPEKADRIGAKLRSAEELLARAEWLREQISSKAPDTGGAPRQQD